MKWSSFFFLLLHIFAHYLGDVEQIIYSRPEGEKREKTDISEILKCSACKGFDELNIDLVITILNSQSIIQM